MWQAQTTTSLKMRTASRTGSPPRTAARFVFAVVLSAVGALSAGCAETPEAFVARFEQALASGDSARVEGLLTPDSRPLYRAMVASAAADGGDNPFAPRPMTRPATVRSVVEMEDAVMIRVQAQGIEREWVLARVGGRHRLDLLATSSRRPWSSD